MRRRRTDWMLIGAALVAGAMVPLGCRRDAAAPAAAAGQTGGPELQQSYSTTCQLGEREARCSLSVSVSKVSDVTVADRIELIMEARAPEGVRVQWPPLGEQLGGLNVLTAQIDDPVILEPLDPGAPQRVLRRRVVLLEPFLPGDRELPRLEVMFSGAQGGGGEVCRVTTDAVKVAVKSLLGTEESREEPQLRGVVALAPEASRLWMWIAAGAVVLGVPCALGARRLLRGPGRAPEALTPYAAAMRRLTELDESDLLGAGRTGEYSAALGELLRRYVGRSAGLGETDRTTEQLLEALGDAPAINVGNLRALLSELDEASYAGVPVAAGVAHELKDRVHKMVVGMQAGFTAAAAEATAGGRA